MTNEGTKKWMNRLQDVLAENRFNETLDNQLLAQSLGISKRDLFRKIKTLTGMTPQKYIRKYRLQQAMQMLESGQCKTVNEVCHKIGYKNADYFSKQFKKEFDIKPFTVLKNEGWR